MGHAKSDHFQHIPVAVPGSYLMQVIGAEDKIEGTSWKLFCQLVERIDRIGGAVSFDLLIPNAE
jgi:hypothetical protein